MGHTKFLIALLFVTQILHAATYEINKDHSRVSFKIPYMTFSEVEGSFTEYKGIIDYDPETETINNIQGSIDANSLNTLDKKRDNHLRGPDFFYVKKYPTINFKFMKASTVKPHHFKVHGELEIRGISRPVVLEAQYRGSKKDHVGKVSLFFKGTTKLNRKDYGMIWNKGLDKNEYLVGDEVQIEMTIQAQPIGKRTAFSTQQIPATVALENLARYRRGEGPRPEGGPSDSEPVVAEKVIKETLPHSPRPTAVTKTSTGASLAIEMIVGFAGFCLLILLGCWVKLKLSKMFKISHYSESSVIAIAGDAIIIAMTLIYSIWYFKYLYP